jgi:hypothetical protein
VPLTIAYTECQGANRSHGPSLTAPSCNPPAPSSDWLTVGTLDANGHLPQSGGFLKATVCFGTTGTGTCSTPGGLSAPDVRLEVNVTDVRCRVGLTGGQSSCQAGALSDYIGELGAALSLRITDKHNTGPWGTSDPATVVDTALRFDVPCSANPGGVDPNAIGATCSVLTHANGLFPGFAVPAKRAVWELGQIEVSDGGQDGAGSTAGNTPFLRQGVFVP